MRCGPSTDIDPAQATGRRIGHESDGPGRDRTCDLGVKSPARQHAGGCNELKDAANRADDRCSKQQRAAPNGDKRLRALYARQLALWTTSSVLGRPRRRRRSLSEGGANTVSRPTGPAVGAGELCLDAPPEVPSLPGCCNRQGGGVPSAPNESRCCGRRPGRRAGIFCLGCSRSQSREGDHARRLDQRGARRAQ